jgi:hypothetical protein
MLKKEKPTLAPSRFTANGLKSLLEAVAEKEPKKSSKGGGGFSDSPQMPEKGYGGKGGEGLEPLSLAGAKYSQGLPLGFFRAGLGLQQADFLLSKAPVGIGQLASMAAVSAALPTALGLAGFGGAEKEAKEKISPYEGESVSPEDMDMLGFAQPDAEPEKPKSLQAKTIKYGNKEISVTPDSMMHKMTDPYKIAPFVEYAKGVKKAQAKEKDMLNLGKQKMPTGKF